jgi:hypothetical protein
MNQTRYSATPVLRAVGVVLTAGQVLECFQPVAARLNGMITAVVRRHAAAAEVRTVALAGGLAGFPLTAPTALAALDRARPPEVAVLEPAAVAVGAAAVGDGVVQVGERAATIGMPVHQVRDGLLSGDRLVLNRSGMPLPIDVDREGAPLVIEVGDLQPPSGAPLVLHVERAGIWQRAVVRPDRPVPPGRYVVGLWPSVGSLGALVLRPVDGGRSHIYTISDRTGPEGAR